MTEKACGSYELVREGEDTIVNINCEACSFFPSIEDNARTMALVVEILSQVTSATKIILIQKREYEYDVNQTQILLDLAKLYKQLMRHKLAYNLLSEESCRRYVDARYAELHDIILNLLKSDPVGAYVELLRISERENNFIKTKTIPEEGAYCLQKYYRLLEDVVGMIQNSKIIILLKPYLADYQFGDREIYKKVFAPMIKPDFMFTKLMASYPRAGEEIDNYSINETEVTIFQLPENVQYLYHIVPPEFKLTEEKYEILDAARKLMAEYKPKKGEFVDPERVRQIFYTIGGDLLDELSAYRGIRLRQKEKEELNDILVRYTVGFGLIEVLLADENIQDVTINSPTGVTPAFIVHSEYGNCMTNVIPTFKEAESWASKLRIISGRPLDEANPILDTEIILPNARARVAAITSPLNPTGIAYALRRHRDKPWTLPLFIKKKMINPLAAGIISFLIDGNRTLLVAGTRSAGKTSLLGSLLTEILRKGRVVTIEDSVTGDSNILIQRNGIVERVQIGKLIDNIIKENGCWYELSGHQISGNYQNISVLSLDKNGKVLFTPISKFIRHKVQKPIYEITTRTGRKIKVTGDHSLFTIGEQAEIKDALVKELKIGDYLITPRILNITNKHKNSINLFDKLINEDKCYLKGSSINSLLINNREKIKKLSKENNFSQSTIQHWYKNKILPAKIVKDLLFLGSNIETNELFFKIGKNSEKLLPVEIKLTSDLLTTIGCWIADGCYDKCSIIISATNEEDRKVVADFANSLSLSIKRHSDNWSLMINSLTLRWIFREGFELKGDAYSKRVPNWIFNISLEQISYVLKGIYSGDGCVSKSEILLHLSSRKLLEDVQTLLLYFSIIMRISKKRKDKTTASSISELRSIKLFKEHIGLLQNYKNNNLEKLCSKKSTHNTTDIIPLYKETKHKLSYIFKDFNYTDYVNRDNNIGRNKLNGLLQQTILKNKLVDNLQIIAQSDIFFDQIREINIIKNYQDYVYDISVPECENFVCDNILAHNTLELPVSALRKLNYNIQSMKVASALTRGTTEVSADEGIRSTLRLGDSSLFIGEIRSVEAKALYEAMRIGALANVVAGTIHGDSPYGVFDRVVNDLEVPRTSFKATDVIIVANPRSSSSGLEKWKRVTQITEVRKQWEDDPLREKGFVDLMTYDPKLDTLVPSSDLLNGDSDVLKSIAGNVKEWAGNWEAVWDNINLRAKIKETIVEVSDKSKMPELLEADFCVLANDEFHRIGDRVKEEVGSLDSKKIFFYWNEWLKKTVKKM